MTQESVITDEMRAAINVESEPLVNDVEAGAIKKFARAIGDTNPLFNDDEAARKSRYGGLIAPPTFLRSMNSGPSNVSVQSPYPANLDGGSEWEYFEPVRPGDRITVTTYLAVSTSVQAGWVTCFSWFGRRSTSTSSTLWWRSSGQQASATSHRKPLGCMSRKSKNC